MFIKKTRDFEKNPFVCPLNFDLSTGDYEKMVSSAFFTLGNDNFDIIL